MVNEAQITDWLEDNLTLDDFIRAYRRAKIDAWYAHTLDVDEVIDFERNFDKRINEVRARVLEVIEGGKFTQNELGGWRLETKDVKPQGRNKEGDSDVKIDEGLLFSNPDKDPRQYEEVKEVSFRLIATPTIFFHIISALWIDKVGYKFDAKLDGHSYGNRLRFAGNKQRDDNRAGSFIYYIKQFRAWRESAIKYAIKNLRDLEEDVVVVTADAQAFYHCLKPDFLTNEKYLNAISLELDDPIDEPLTKLIQSAINEWSAGTPLETGLPVGLPASAVIANAALCEFDNIIRDQIQPVFYGRYVDDVLLVLKWIKKWKNIGDIWMWMQNKASGSAIFCVDDKGKPCRPHDQGSGRPVELVFSPHAYKKTLTDTNITFKGNKCKAFFLDPETGLPLVEALQKRIKELSSEFRLLPEHIGEEKHIRTKIRHLIPEDGNNSDNFRKINSQEFRRSDFMELLKELEGYERVLPPQLWIKQRNEFYKAFNSILMVWPFFVDFEKYIPRVVGLMTRNADFANLKDFLDRIMSLLGKIDALKDKMYISGAGKVSAKEYIEHWTSPLKNIIRSAILSNIKGKDSGIHGYKDKYHEFAQSYKVQLLFEILPDYDSGFEDYARAYLIHDVSNERLAMLCQRNETQYISKIGKLGAFALHDCMRIDDCRKIFNKTFIYCASLVVKAINESSIESDGIPFGILFPTRPISLRIIPYFRRDVLRRGDAARIIKAFRGYGIGKKISLTLDILLSADGKRARNDSDSSIVVVADKPRKEVNVALMSVRTSGEHIHLQMKKGCPKGLLAHYKKIVGLVNGVLRNETRPQYILFHELGLPPLWFTQIAEKCFANGVSLISGVDYILGKKPKTCYNEVWMSLVSLDGDFPELAVVTEKKDKFAYSEADELLVKYGYEMAELRQDEKIHKIVSHGNFAFSTLICSELLEMPKRCRLIGKIDALFVVSWNQDRETFEDIIKATASDIHAYVVFCNNNVYGDSRVRVPKKDRWARDVVEVRGGEEPYFVVGKLEVYELRKFQSHSNPNLLEDGKFKPLPMGFKIDEARRVDV